MGGVNRRWKILCVCVHLCNSGFQMNLFIDYKKKHALRPELECSEFRASEGVIDEGS